MSPHTVLEPLRAVAEQLWAAGLVIWERWPHVPRVSGFRWEILACTAVVVCLVRSGLSFRRRKGHCAQKEVSGKGMEKTEPDAPACGAVASSEQKASPLPLQILALAALNQGAGYFSVENATQLLKGVRERLLKNSHQLTDENPFSGAAQEDGEPPARKMPEGIKDSPDLQGSAEAPVQAIGSGGETEQEEAGEAGRPERADGGVRRQATGEGQSQRCHTLSQILLKLMHLLELLRDHLEGGGSSRQVETGSSSTDHVPSGGSPVNTGRPSRALKKARSRNEELPRNKTTHQAEQVSFHLRNTLLESEIQKLLLKLEAEPKLCEEHIKHVERKMMEEKARCLQVKNKLAKVRRKADAAHWNLGLYRNMAQDLHGEWQKISSLHERERLLVETRWEASQKAVLWAEREFGRLQAENHCLRQKLANSGPKVQPVSGGPPAPAPAVLGTASKSPSGPKAPLKAQKPKKGARVHWPDSKFSGPLRV